MKLVRFFSGHRSLNQGDVADYNSQMRAVIAMDVYLMCFVLSRVEIAFLEGIEIAQKLLTCMCNHRLCYILLLVHAKALYIVKISLFESQS